MAWKNQWSSCQCYHYLIIFYRSNSCTDFGDLNVDIQISDWLEADNGDVHGANCWKYCLFDTFNQSSFVFLKFFHFSFFRHLKFCWSFLVFCNQNLSKNYWYLNCSMVATEDILSKHFIDLRLAVFIDSNFWQHLVYHASQSMFLLVCY